ncbi:MAG TPA: hypothetical protein VKX41_00450 [Alloacidobacterium sp.]|jgi:hypothetical protein|nr:hypothetical protein [Alloacidobacterium sp.]
MRRNSGFRSIVTYAVAAVVLAGAGLVAQAQRIPSGTNIVVRNNTELSSGTATTGQRWSGTLVEDVNVDGKVIAPAGSKVRGRVADAESSGRLSKPGILSLEVTSVNGVPVTTDMYAVDGQGHTKSNVTKIGGGAAVGALLGGIFGGGKGAAIGALAGGGAGTAGAAATGKKEAKIGAETTMTFKVQ